MRYDPRQELKTKKIVAEMAMRRVRRERHLNEAPPGRFGNFVNRVKGAVAGYKQNKAVRTYNQSIAPTIKAFVDKWQQMITAGSANKQAFIQFIKKACPLMDLTATINTIPDSDFTDIAKMTPIITNAISQNIAKHNAGIEAPPEPAADTEASKKADEWIAMATANPARANSATLTRFVKNFTKDESIPDFTAGDPKVIDKAAVTQYIETSTHTAKMNTATAEPPAPAAKSKWIPSTSDPNYGKIETPDGRIFSKSIGSGGWTEQANATSPPVQVKKLEQIEALETLKSKLNGIGLPIPTESKVRSKATIVAEMATRKRRRDAGLI